MTMLNHAILILLLPLASAVVIALFLRQRGAVASWLSTGVAGAIAALSIHLLLGGERFESSVEWLRFGTFSVSLGVKYDDLAALMLFIVGFVGFLIHVFSLGYMHDDKARARFFGGLSIFMFSMIGIVLADNLFMIFIFWELVGFSSWLLINHYHEKQSAADASKKAFIVNRVGDFGFALGIFGIWAVFGTLDFDAVFQAAPAFAGKTFEFAGMQLDILTTLCLLLFVGAMGKSAQLGLHTWLPDAMEGPTPVSALIHAATMVTAGVFLVCRASPMFELSPFALQVVTIVGASTAFFAATVGLFQNDIKRVIAYSTCSQLGYMFAAAGVAAYNAAMFHLFTHAFFKALLFLGAGSVIHAMHHEQDMRRMGGLAKAIPFTWAMMLIGNLALTGVGLPLLHIGFAGFYSKDAIINSTFAAHTGVGSFAFTLLVVAAGMTSFYSWRQFLLTFHGPYRGDAHHAHGHDHAPAAADDDHGHDDHHHAPPKLSEVHESPLVMLVPLGVLALGAIFSGGAFYHYFLAEGAHEFWRHSLVVPEGHEGHLPLWVEFAPLVVTIIGFLIAYYYYILHPKLAAAIQAKQSPIYLFFYNKWYFDELYDFLFVRPALKLGRFLWKRGDGTVIDGLGPDGIAARVLDATRGAVKLQSGYLYHYALAMLLGVVALATWFVATQGGAP